MRTRQADNDRSEEYFLHTIISPLQKSIPRKTFSCAYCCPIQILIQQLMLIVCKSPHVLLDYFPMHQFWMWKHFINTDICPCECSSHSNISHTNISYQLQCDNNYSTLLLPMMVHGTTEKKFVIFWHFSINSQPFWFSKALFD